MLPADRRDVRKERIWKGDSILPQCIDSTLEIDRVPQYDNKDDQVEAARAVTLVFESSVAEFALAVVGPEPLSYYRRGFPSPDSLPGKKSWYRIRRTK